MCKAQVWALLAQVLSSSLLKVRTVHLLKVLEVASSQTLPAFAEFEFFSPPRETLTTRTTFYRALVGQIGNTEVDTAG